MKDSVGRLGKGFKTVTIYSSEPRISIKGIYSKWIYADTPKQIQVEFQTLYEGEKLEEEHKILSKPFLYQSEQDIRQCSLFGNF